LATQTASIERYSRTYRQNELALITSCARRGESLCLVGVAGVGKTNIVRILRSNDEFKARYLGADVSRVRFAILDVNRWEQTPTHLWQLMLEALQIATIDLSPPPANTVVPISEEDRLSQRLLNHINWVCQSQQQQIVFVLDDCDLMLARGPLNMINSLNAFRDAGNPGKLSFLLFTKRLPHVLGRPQELDKSKFYDLIKRNIYALGLYTFEDARQMVRYLNDQAGNQLRREDLAHVEHLGGGHSGLIRTIFETWLRAVPDRQDMVGFFARQPDIQAECQRILRGLHEQEREVALRFSRNQLNPEDAPLLQHLMRRTIILERNPPIWFSPLMSPVLSGGM
jgi:hypothetical protein